MHIDRHFVRPLAWASGWLLLAAGSLIVVLAVPAAHFALPAQFNLALHTVWETVSIVVSALVFSVGFLRLGSRWDDSLRAASALFLPVAILDFVHVLSYDGMPEFVTPSGGGKAIVFFLAARLLAAVGMIAMASPWQAPAYAPRRWLAMSLAFTAAVIAIGFDERTKALFFVSGQGLTPFKVACELLLATLYALAAAGFLLRMRKPQQFPVVHLFAAAGLMGVSELCLSLYATTRDQYTNLGHLWKVVGYLFVYRALLLHIVQRPFVELEAAHAELDAANATLEQRVRARTALLEAANRDIESFSFSVAHDLRAPLNAIGGFAGALQAHASERLNADELRYLARIRENAVTMSEMIDALLDLSRLSRAAPRFAEVDLSSAGEKVLEELRRAEPGRPVETTVQPGLVAVGDAALLRTALQNLLGNAWKFTAAREPARIAFGAFEQDGERVFCVRDNGEGFDMAHAGRLFGLFERLHSDAAYGGHGIGLANVRRIVSLHGGRVWAQGAPGQGATFYFTLPGAAAVARAAGREG